MAYTRRMREGSLRRLALAAVAASVGSLLAFLFLETAYLWCALAWAAVAAYAMLRSETVARRALWFNVAVVLLAVGAFEGFVGSSSPRSLREERWNRWWDSIYQRDDVLGHRAKPGYKNSCELLYDGQLVFDATYTIDEDGLRVGPTEAEDAPRACVLFFGGSYTFGEGVDDEATMPYLVGARSAGLYRVRNFGFSGYGPHQMLAQIESGVVARVADCDPAYAVYQAHPHHVLRAGGKWWWDHRGPRYTMTTDGDAHREGNFDDGTGFLDGLLTRSAAARRARDAVRPDENDVELFHAIVHRSRRLLEQAYPGIEFHVLYWDVGDPRLFDDDDRTTQITVHRVTDIFPERQRWEGVYTFEHDVHPTPHAHSLLAGHIVRNVLTHDGATARSGN